MRKAAMTTSDIVTAKPFAKPFIPSLGKRPKPNAISATATATAIRETIEDIEEQRRRCDLQMREVPSNIQEFVQRYEAASPRQLTLRLPELVRIARGIDPGET
jgi:hypothetical protein